jgi:hypothetical protein
MVAIGEHCRKSVRRTRFEPLNGMHAGTEHHINRAALAHALFGSIRRRKKRFRSGDDCRRYFDDKERR